MRRTVSRRKLLQGAAVAAGAAVGSRFFPAPALLAERSPNSSAGTVVIGCANQGKISLNAAAKQQYGSRLLALVDVDDTSIDWAKGFLTEKYPDVKLPSLKTYFDYRKMLDDIHKDVDAVFVCTPDHTHAVIAMACMKLGKSVYVEKPLAHSIAECRALAEAAKKYKVVTQLGNQGHSGEGVRRLCEYIEAGAIGDVTETHSWAPTGRGGVGGRLPTLPVPSTLHWDQWIGPAKFRDYHAELHPKVWRSWWDFGDGSVGDWGCHNLDGPYTALKLSNPTSVESVQREGGSDERYPMINTLLFNFPARGNMPPLKAYWYDGYRGGLDPNAADKDEEKLEAAQNRPPIVAKLEAEHGRKLGNGGCIFVGTKGVIYTNNYCGSVRILPESQHQATPVPEPKLPRVKGTHQSDFLRAVIQGGDPPASNFEYAAPFCEIILQGCMAERAGLNKPITFDPVKMTTGVPELDAMVKREYRKGWSLD